MWLTNPTWGSRNWLWSAPWTTSQAIKCINQVWLQARRLSDVGVDRNGLSPDCKQVSPKVREVQVQGSAQCTYLWDETLLCGDHVNCDAMHRVALKGQLLKQMCPFLWWLLFYPEWLSMLICRQEARLMQVVIFSEIWKWSALKI